MKNEVWMGAIVLTFALCVTVVVSTLLAPVRGLAMPDLAVETGLSFIAIGDTPYSDREAKRFKDEIPQAIARSNVPFVVHYGDFKAGNLTCTDELFVERRDAILGLHPGRVFFTPGDNDWTDCDRSHIATPISELDRLDRVRRLFFEQPLDLPESWRYARQPNFPENARWMKEGVLFVTLHIVGTNNGRQEILLDDVEAALALVEARDQANRVWLQAAFEQAKQARASAVVIVTQADVTQPDGSGACTAFDRANCDAFADVRAQLRRHASKFRDRGQPRKPVLLIHGDTNPYCLDKQFGGNTAPNLWRLNAWGDFQQPADATAIAVQPNDANEPFVIQTLLGHQVPTNGCD